MTDRAVHFEAIEVHRVLGIKHGEGFKLTDLSHGVNLIHGPNGSGKSTTALVIQELLWTGRTGLERPTVAGRFRDADINWWISIEAGHAQTTCDGQPGTVPELGPPENRHRYHLALHELIGDDNAEFAKAIADASQGGYDLEAAAGELRFTDRPSSPRKQSKQLKESRHAVEGAGRDQRDIDLAAGQLPDLRKQRDEAAAAERHINLLQKAQDHCDAEDKCRQVELKLNARPEGVAKLRGDEREKLNQLAQQREQLEKDLEAEYERVAHAAEELDELRLPDGGVDKEVVARLRSRQHRLNEVESDFRHQRQQLAKADAEAKKAREKLGQHFTDDQLALIDTIEIGELSTFARRSDQVRALEKVLEEQRRWLDREEPKEVQGLDEQQIRDGTRALGQWLASPAPTTKIATRLWWPIIIATAVMTVLGFILAFVHHWSWILLVLTAAGVAMWDLWLRRSSTVEGTADLRAAHRRSYEATRLKPPQAWQASAVSDLMCSLVHVAAVRACENERIRRLNDLHPDVEALDQQRSELDRQRDELEERLGLCIEIADEWLPLLVDNIGLWQSRSAEAAGAKKVLSDLEQDQQRLLDEINTTLQPFGYDGIDSAETVVRSIDNLADRQSRYRSAITERTDGRRRIKQTIEPGLQDVTDQRHNIFNRLGVDESDEPTIDDWLAERPNYLDLKTKLAEAETIRNDRRQALAKQEQLLELDPVDIQKRIDQQRTIAAKRDALSEQIAGIEGDIERARAGHELSNALVARDAAVSALAEARAQGGGAVVGALLTRWVRTVAVERSRPQVFRRANELLVRFTRGTLRLELDDHARPPGFRARLGSDPPRPVDQLSVGERVQLLIAVRLAFLEQDEQTRLPLLLDQTLGTSDDGRAGVIIDTVIEIAREGRQVFYFTAQHSEVAKWITRLNESGTTYKVIDLAQTRQLGAAAVAPLQIASVDAPQPPAPDGMSHDEYGRTLGVPNMNPVVEKLDGLHLWQ